MKPAAVAIVLSLGVLAGRAAAQYQAPGQFTEPPEPSPTNYVGDHFALCPAPWSRRLHEPPADAFLWSDYRGACIEHDLYRPRYLASPSEEPRHSRPLLSALGNWLNSLFAWLPDRRQRVCQQCEPLVAAQTRAAHEGGAAAACSPGEPPATCRRVAHPSHATAGARTRAAARAATAARALCGTSVART
jgi:hypothetical protein